MSLIGNNLLNNRIVMTNNKKLIGHGGCGYFNSNSKKAIDYAINSGCHSIEVDIQYCKDGFICWHDNQLPTFEFIDNKTIKECLLYNILSLIELSGLVQNSNIEIIFDCKFNVKYTNEFYMVVGQLFKRYIISSFYEEHLLLDYKHKMLLTSNIPLDLFNEQINKLGISIIGMYYNNLTKEIIDILNTKNIEVYIYTVNNSVLCKSLLEMGVDGIITDYP
jgi:glycerophosphoryl diester phosphodiesterase